MLKFIFKRLLEALPTLFILITFSFFLMRLAPGSPFTSERAYPPEVMANIEAKYHLNEPLHKQYFLYLENLSKGDFGPSFLKIRDGRLRLCSGIRCHSWYACRAQSK